MAKNETNITVKNYKKTGIIAAIVLVVAALGIWAIASGKSSKADTSVADAIADVSTNAVSGADMRIAVIRMDMVQNDAMALKDLRNQKESFEKKLRDDLTAEQKTLEKEKSEIEKSQGMLAPEALQRRVAEYQKRVAALQRDLSERAQSIEESYQRALAEIQDKHLDPVIEGIIAKKNLSLVIDGRFARTGMGIADLDITNEVVSALNKKVSGVKMEKPKGF